MPSYNLRLRLVIFCLLCLILWQTLRYFPTLAPFSTEQSTLDVNRLDGSRATLVPVTVAVYYEALCPDSRSFFTKQLLPTFEQAERLVQIFLIPYGKAKTQKSGNSYEFTCQHGPVECKANKVHACVIERVSRPDVQLKYITCMISDNMEPMEIGESCGKTFGVEWEPIYQCAAGDEGSKLLQQYGEATDNLSPRATFIPTILINGSQGSQPAILKNLLKEVCKKFESAVTKPVECESFS